MLIALLMSLTGCLATAHADDGTEECGCDGPQLAVIEADCVDGGYIDVPTGTQVVGVHTCSGLDGSGQCRDVPGWEQSANGLSLPDCAVMARVVILEP